MRSLCRKICLHDPARDLCAGCGRTLAEIENWLVMSEEERAAVMEKLPERLRSSPAS